MARWPSEWPQIATATGGTLSLQLLGATDGKLATSLTTVDGGLVSLEMSGASVVGKDTLGHTVLSIAIVDNQLQVSLLEPLNHGTDGNTAYDEVLTLLTVGTDSALQLVYTVTQTDADGDSITRSATVDLAGTTTGSLSFDDDGPTLAVTANTGAAAAMALNLDETAGATDLYATGETHDTAIDDDAGLRRTVRPEARPSVAREPRSGMHDRGAAGGAQHRHRLAVVLDAPDAVADAADLVRLGSHRCCPSLLDRR